MKKSKTKFVKVDPTTQQTEADTVLPNPPGTPTKPPGKGKKNDGE
jgi:hypothetical protein